MADETQSEDTPKRKYTRRSYTGVSAIDAAINSAIDGAKGEIIADAGIEDGDIEVEEVEVEKPSSGFIYQEPTTDSVTAKMMRKLGIGGRMEPMAPWKGHPQWQCSRCKWQTLDKIKAKRHVCS